MSKSKPFSEKYVRIMKLANSVGLIVSLGTALLLFLLPFLTELPKGSNPWGRIGVLAIIGVLCASRLESLEEHEAIYKAIAESAEKKD
jgi:hypothetical protein